LGGGVSRRGGLLAARRASVAGEATGIDVSDDGEPRLREKRIDVGPLEPWRGELVTKAIEGAVLDFRYGGVRDMRPLFCPECRRHFTSIVRGGQPGRPGVMHIRCADCGGDGRP
jgi:hypothetical protein